MAENSTPKLNLEFTLQPHPVAFMRDVMTSSNRALAVVAMQDVEDEPTDAAPIPPLELICGAQGPEDLRDLAAVFAVLAQAIEAGADQLDAQQGAATEKEA